MPRRAFAEVDRYAMAAALAGRFGPMDGQAVRRRRAGRCPVACRGRTTADDVTIAFDSLAAEDGQTITTFSSQGFTVEEVGGMTVVGPSNPAYAGAVGLIPSSGDYLEIYVTPNPGQFGVTTYDLSDITVTFASATGPSNPQNIIEYVDAKYYYGMPVAGDIAADWNWQGTVAGPTAFTGSVLADDVASMTSPYPTCSSTTCSAGRPLRSSPSRSTLTSPPPPAPFPSLPRS